MKIYFLYCIMIILLLSQCKSKDNFDVAINTNDSTLNTLNGIPKPLWKVSLMKTKTFGDVNYWFDELPISGDIVMIGVNDINKAYLAGFDINNGVKKWVTYPNIKYSSNVYDKAVIYGNNYILPANHSVYEVNMINGNMIELKNNPDYSFFGSTKQLGHLFAINLEKKPKPVIIVGNMLDNSIIELPDMQTVTFTPNVNNGQLYGISDFDFIILDNNQTNIVKDTCICLICYEYKPNITDYSGESLFFLYSLTQKKWLYERVKIDDDNIGGGTLNNTYHYTIVNSDKVKCIDIVNKKLVYEKLFQYLSFVNKLVYYNNKLYVFHTSGNAIVFNAINGNKLFEIEANGIPSALKFLNGVLYWVDFGSGRLRAADAETGERLWNIESPDVATEGKKFFFSTQIGVAEGKNGQKGKIIVSTYLNAYCYEAIR